MFLRLHFYSAPFYKLRRCIFDDVSHKKKGIFIYLLLIKLESTTKADLDLTTNNTNPELTVICFSHWRLEAVFHELPKLFYSFLYHKVIKSVQLLVCHLKSHWKHRVVASAFVHEFLGFAGKMTNVHRTFFTFCSKVSRSGHRKNWEMSWEATLNGHRDGERVRSRGCSCSMAPLRPWDTIKKTVWETLSDTAWSGSISTGWEPRLKNDRLSFFCTEKTSFFPPTHFTAKPQNHLEMDRESEREREMELVIEARNWQRWRFGSDSEKGDQQ